MECSEISFLRSHSEQIPQKSTILGSRNFWKRIRWDSKEPYEMITKLDIRPVLFILHYFFIFCWVLSMGHKVRCNQCSLISKSLLYLHQNSKGNLWLSGVQVIFTHFHFCENKMWVCMYVCVCVPWILDRYQVPNLRMWCCFKNPKKHCQGYLGTEIFSEMSGIQKSGFWDSQRQSEKKLLDFIFGYRTQVLEPEARYGYPTHHKELCTRDHHIYIGSYQNAILIDW